MIRIYAAENYDEMSEKAARIIAAQVIVKPECVLGLATGSSPVGTYQRLVERYKAGKLSFAGVTTVNLDEYKGLSGTHDQSYRYFMQHNLFDHVNIDVANTNVPNGLAEDPEAECQRYNQVIHDMGGIDIQVLGMGHNGHIGFNEPADHFPLETHVVELQESTINANARFFASKDEVPKKAMTMGIRSIMQARQILVVVSGEDKAEIVKKAFFGPVTPQVPASILQMHPNVVLVGDKAALSKIL